MTDGSSVSSGARAGRWRRRLVVTATAAVAVVGTTAAVVVVEAPSTRSAATSVSTTAPSSTTLAPTTTTTLPPLPVPQPPPTDPYAAVPVRWIGTITIPAIGLVHPIYEGIWLTVIDHGPGHWPGTAMPGQVGNAVFPGHRVTHSHPFLDLDRLRPGDAIVFHDADGTFTYSVTGTTIVTPKDMWVVDQTRERTVTLIACHPKHSAAERIVVKGVLVRSQPATGPASSASAA